MVKFIITPTGAIFVKVMVLQKKTSSLSLDDVFGTYSTDDECTKHSRGSVVPSLYKEKDEKEEDGKKATTKADESQKSRNEKEKVENTRRSSLKKERKKEKLEESDEGEFGAEGKKVFLWLIYHVLICFQNFL